MNFVHSVALVDFAELVVFAVVVVDSALLSFVIVGSFDLQPALVELHMVYFHI